MKISSMFTDLSPSRTDRRGWQSHCHRLVWDEFTDAGERYLWRCVDCGTRLKRKSGVVIGPRKDTNEPKKNA